MSAVAYNPIDASDVELGLGSSSEVHNETVGEKPQEEETSSTIENTITPKSNVNEGFFLTPLAIDHHQSLTLSKSSPLSPGKVERQVSNPVTKEEKLRASGAVEQSESGTKSLKLLSLLSQDTSKKLKLQRRSGGYFRPVNSSTRLFYCTICLENHAKGSAFSLEACSSKHEFCLPCVQTYCTVQINDGIVRHVCPYEGCNALASEAEIRFLVDDATFAKFERFSHIKQDPNYRECSACNASITVPEDIIHHRTDNNQLKCANCGHQTCFLHGDSHPKETCKQYGRRINRVERASARVVASTTRRCPECQSATEKNGGCNHMTCRHCRCEWCWLCGRRMESGHYEPTNILGCPGSQFSMAPDFAIWSCLDRLGCGGVVNLPVVRFILNLPLFVEYWFYHGVAGFIISLCAVFFFILMVLYFPFVAAYYCYRDKKLPKFSDLFPIISCTLVSFAVAFLVWLVVQIVWLPLALLHMLLTIVTSRCSSMRELLNKETLLRHFGRPFLMMYERFSQWYGLDDDE